ncbi:hypothetical protein [Halogeometricum limi]|uniref:Uncharacterized protein n=1 Tax=Halogeometricum limi TaxID=555875 RepID=A0A1I6H609_9EURY|nr:hypothetical protein [Halogeometricum limi]SFR49844.1 hypothetical protein SAMN04488124_1814 [Halogeometricum limi]
MRYTGDGTTRRSFLRGGVLATAVAAVGLPTVAGTAVAKGKKRRPGTVPVFESDVGDPGEAGKTFYRVAQAGTAADDFVKGPEKAPFGSGSVELTTNGPGDRLFLYNYDYGTFDVSTGTESNDGVPLAAITELSYSTYTNDTTLVPALKMEIDPDGPGTSGVDDYATLNFEPYYNNTVTPGTWQTWDVLTANAGVWLSGTSGEGSISDPVTWTRLLELYPDATIRFGFGVGVGSGWSAPSFVGNVDDLRIGVDGKTTRYNFEARGNSKK